MLRPMSVKRSVLLLALSLALVACGNETATSATSDSGDRHVDRLLALADEAAERHGGEALYVEAVETTRRTAEGLSGSTSNQPDVAVWVVQVSGSEYACEACSKPQGAEAPEGRYLTLVPTADTYEGTSFGISPEPKDLASLGEVEVLRDER
jgi:hypothetical protein